MYIPYLSKSFRKKTKRAGDVLFPRGLQNLGNTCYVNSVLQALAAIPIFITKMESVRPTIHACLLSGLLSDRENHNVRLLKELCDLLAEMGTSSIFSVSSRHPNSQRCTEGESHIAGYMNFPLPFFQPRMTVTPLSFLAALFRLPKRPFIHNQQQDAHVFLNVLFSTFRNEIRYIQGEENPENIRSILRKGDSSSNLKLPENREVKQDRITKNVEITSTYSSGNGRTKTDCDKQVRVCEEELGLQYAGHTPCRKHKPALNEDSEESLKLENDCVTVLDFTTNTDRLRQTTKKKVTWGQGIDSSPAMITRQRLRDMRTESIIDKLFSDSDDLITSLFRGYGEQKIQCSKCKVVHKRREEFFECSVPVQIGKPVQWSLQTLKSRWSTGKEQMINCDACNQKQKAQMWWEATELPLVCTIYLKIFPVIQKRATLRFDAPLSLKIGELLTFNPSFSHFDLYHLNAVVCFQNSSQLNGAVFLQQGHFFTLVKKQCEDGSSHWFKMDDDQVSMVSQNEIKNYLRGNVNRVTPYMLFYVSEIVTKYGSRQRGIAAM